jgi:hypothetical protein
VKINKVIVFSFFIFGVALLLPRFWIFKSLCSRSYECASLYRAPQGPFHREFSHQNEKICGDLATMANKPDLCSYRSEIFLTDPWGYRNSADVWKRPNDIILFGDSFALGQGVTQELTPAVRLSKISHHWVYDAGGKFEFNFLRWVLDHQKKPIKFVVFLHLERHHHSPVEVGEWDKVINENSFVEMWNIFWKTFTSYNPIRIVASRFEKKILIPAIFPNRFSENSKLFALENNKDFLFLPTSVEMYGEPRDPASIEKEGAYFEGLQEKLNERRVRLIVGLVPEKFSVYLPLIKNKSVEILKFQNKQPLYLNLLSFELTRRKLKNINLLPILRDQAMRDFSSRSYNYWPDDTHWNEYGINFAMEEIAKLL